MRHLRQKWQVYSLLCNHFVLNDAPRWWCFSRWPWNLGTELIMRARVTPTASDRLTQWLPSEISCVTAHDMQVCVCVSLTVEIQRCNWLCSISSMVDVKLMRLPNMLHSTTGLCVSRCRWEASNCCSRFSAWRRGFQIKCDWSVPRENDCLMQK